MSWESDALYVIKDMVTTSLAEKNCKKYSSAISRLENQLDTIRHHFTQAADQILDIFTPLPGSGDPSTGKMIFDFESRRETVKSDMNSLVFYYSEMENSVNEKLEIAREELQRWTDIAVREDEEKKEYQGD